MNRFLKSLTTISLVASATILVAMMLLTALDVGLRYLVNSPIPGGLELVEFMMAIIIPFSLVVTAYEKAHIEVDMLLEKVPAGLQETVGCLTDATSLVFYSMITWQGFLYISEQCESGLTSAVLLIPQYPFVASLTSAFAVLTTITLFFVFQRISALITKWIP